MADRNHGPALRRGTGHDRPNGRHASRVLPGRGLVEDQDGRAHRQDGGEREQLPARVAQVVGVGVGLRGQPDGLQRGPDMPG